MSDSDAEQSFLVPEGTPIQGITSFEVIQRKRIVVRGIVQGVGFRPFVYNQAQHWKLAGFVQNDTTGVTIEVEGPVRSLDYFLSALHSDAPPLARIDSISEELLVPNDETQFVILQSKEDYSQRHALISPDAAICDICLQELFDPTNRRYRYPFINCTNCGPRFTIIQDIPYDRAKTTMSVFPLCLSCQYEYNNPLDRRFHAQPNACPVCGPQLSFVDWIGSNPEKSSIQETDSSNDQPIILAVSALTDGKIIAVKGLGGYHLACNAFNDETVGRLRQRKHREEKPFAIMVPDLETAMQLCIVNPQEAVLLQSYHRPIVLLQRATNCPVSAAVAPSNETLGVMLPYTPLHYLLLRQYRTEFPADQPIALVMTSANLSEEPIIYQDEEVFKKLTNVADSALLHNRTIYIRCDDSVVRSTDHGIQFFRRSRGYAPEPLSFVPKSPLPLLACGAHLKNTFCLVKESQVILSHHIGDLESLETLLSFRTGIEHFMRLFTIYPEVIVYDLHPEYLSTKYALETDIPCKIGVQHHEAHIASVMVEHNLSEPIIGIAADGAGYGVDGTIWGGEIFVGDLHHFERFAHLATVPLPGGDQAVRQPWRLGAVYLSQAFGEDFLKKDIPFVRQLDHQQWRILAHMIARNIQCTQTSSMGRLFDAIAALVGIREYVLYEGQAAIELEGQASLYALKHSRDEKESSISPYPFALAANDSIIDVSPLIQALVEDIERGETVQFIAWRFHISIAELLADISEKARQQTGLKKVVLSGGVFQNRLLLELLIARLEKRAFQVYINKRVPPNDGGISLGQAAIAVARLHF